MAFMKARDWTLEETPEGPRLTIPTPCLWPLSLFLAVWLSGWVGGEVSAVRSLLGIFGKGACGPGELLPGAFLMFWLTGWTVGGAAACGVFLFSLKGAEIVTLREGTLSLKLETFLGLGWTRRLPVAGMAPPKIAAAEVPTGAQPRDGSPAPRYALIALESGGKKWKLGVGLPEQRAKDLLHALTSRFGLPRERA